MILTLMKTDSDIRVVDKSITVLDSVNCNVYNDCTILSPVMLLSYASILAECNYAYIEEWGRYYFVGNPVMLSGGRCILPLTVDVLMSHADEIKALHCNVSRYEHAGITMLPDSNISVNGVRTKIFSFTGSDVTFSQSYVLNVLGGV